MKTNFTKHKDDIESILSSMDREHDKLQERIDELENEVEKLKNGEE